MAWKFFQPRRRDYMNDIMNGVAIVCVAVVLTIVLIGAFVVYLFKYNSLQKGV